VDGWVGGWMGGWMDGSKSHFKDCLQQSKIQKSNNVQITIEKKVRSKMFKKIRQKVFKFYVVNAQILHEKVV
jgi:hypothetical protein